MCVSLLALDIQASDKDSETFTVRGVSFTMIKVKGGSYQMGKMRDQDVVQEENEFPIHKVILTDFYIGEFEVTQKLWLAVMGRNPSEFTAKRGYVIFSDDLNLPVERVSWDDCQEFIKRLNQLTGKNFRLPTEAEWEYAAKGGAKGHGYKYAGSNTLNEVAWYNINGQYNTGSPHPVGKLASNELGLFDMTGNVKEWCSDGYGPYSNSIQLNPKGINYSSKRVVRGGSFITKEEECYVTNRSYLEPSVAWFDIGLRLAMTDSIALINAPIIPKEKSQVEKDLLSSYTDHTSAIKTSRDYETKADNILCFTVKNVKFNMVRVEGGQFTMGGTDEQGDEIRDDEKPTHEVTLSDYYIGETEVTLALWKAVMGSVPTNYSGARDLTLAAGNVTWVDCKDFITKLNQITGMTFRFPTEAEWEYAARGGNQSRGYMYSGSNDINEVAWYDYNADIYSTLPVATKKPNELGLYDMSGNAKEWCKDRYQKYTQKPEYDPQGGSLGEYRVLRGGDRFSEPTECRVSYRSLYHPRYTLQSYGLRLALSDTTDLPTSQLVNPDNNNKSQIKEMTNSTVTNEQILSTTVRSENEDDKPIIDGLVGYSLYSWSKPKLDSHLSGRVTIRITVNSDGKVANATIIRVSGDVASDKEIRELCKEAALNSVFVTPTRFNQGIGTLTYIWD